MRSSETNLNHGNAETKGLVSAERDGYIIFPRVKRPEYETSHHHIYARDNVPAPVA